MPLDAAHPLGLIHGAPHLAGRVALVGTAALGAVLGRLQLAWRDLETNTWWASNGRDLLNLLSVAALTVALTSLGLPLGGAILLAAQVELLAVILETALLSRPHTRHGDAVVVGAATLLSLPLAAAPQRAFALLEELARLAG